MDVMAAGDRIHGTRVDSDGLVASLEATERTPVGLSEFRTLADCQLAQTQAMIRASDPATDMGAVETSGTPVARTVSRFACVPFGWRPTRIEPGGLWK
jgi:hypothetical protein